MTQASRVQCTTQPGGSAREGGEEGEKRKTVRVQEKESPSPVRL